MRNLEKNIENVEVQNFLVEYTLINPLEKLVKQLQDGEMRDCDIEYLSNKLHKAIEIASDLLDINIKIKKPNRKGTRLNDYTKKYYVDNYNKLISFFKTYLN